MDTLHVIKSEIKLIITYDYSTQQWRHCETTFHQTIDYSGVS
jgi:hypothetical protein